VPSAAKRSPSGDSDARLEASLKLLGECGSAFGGIDSHSAQTHAGRHGLGVNAAGQFRPPEALDWNRVAGVLESGRQARLRTVCS
jgi:hypothetical protein